VSLIDIPPTLLDSAGLNIPEQMQGRSILPLTRGDTDNWPDDVFVQISESQVGRAVRTRRWKYGVTTSDKHGANDPGSDHCVEEYLYDLDADPYELNNLVGRCRLDEVTSAMRKRLVSRMVDAGESAPTIEPVPTPSKSQWSISPEEAME